MTHIAALLFCFVFSIGSVILVAASEWKVTAAWRMWNKMPWYQKWWSKVEMINGLILPSAGLRDKRYSSKTQLLLLFSLCTQQTTRNTHWSQIICSKKKKTKKNQTTAAGEMTKPLTTLELFCKSSFQISNPNWLIYIFYLHFFQPTS